MVSNLQRQALSAAAQWVARLAAEPGDLELHSAWLAWREESSLNQWAWQRVEMLQSQLQCLPGVVAINVMDAAADQSRRFGRRTLLKSVVIGAGVSAIGWSGYRQAPQWMADQRTTTGERHNLSLDDGTRLSLNTASSVDIRYTAEQRLLILRAGEILVETAPDPRPLLVRSAQGEMRALGTRFTVRQFDDFTAMSVLQHAVAVRQGIDPAETVVTAGQTVTFDTQRMLSRRANEPGDGAWAQGRLIVDDWRLDRLLAELARYRPGYLGCATEISHLMVSGAYSLDDIDLTLNALTHALPVRLITRTRYWTTVVPRG
ncbi:FecR domain-containing protein [Pseudomonas tritici]|uniref:FecR domain-containing protein n=1 Tax=Pseudomonas tritici TaxID=2745518 RepID=UPI00387B9A99